MGERACMYACFVFIEILSYAHLFSDTYFNKKIIKIVDIILLTPMAI